MAPDAPEPQARARAGSLDETRGLSRPEKAAAWVYLGAFGAVFALSLYVTPSPEGLGTHTGLGLPPCGLYERTGVPCLSCGMTTCFAHMARGQVVDGVRVHPFGALLFASLAGAWFASAWALAAGWSFLGWLERRAWSFWGPFAGALALLSWIYKILVTR